MKLSVGETAPNFTLQDTTGSKVELNNELVDRQIVLLFFPLAFSGTCTKELCSIRDNMKIYDSLDTKVIAISVDSFFTLRAYKKSENLNFTLLSDFNRKVSASYGTLYNDYYGMEGVSKRSSFVVGRDGAVKHIEILENADELPDFGAILESLNRQCEL